MTMRSPAGRKLSVFVALMAGTVFLILDCIHGSKNGSTGPHWMSLGLVMTSGLVMPHMLSPLLNPLIPLFSNRRSHGTH